MNEQSSVKNMQREGKQASTPSQTSVTEIGLSPDSSAARICSLHHAIGNQAVERLLRSGIIQAKLTIGEPVDIYEQEADRISDDVMRMPEPAMQPEPVRLPARVLSRGQGGMIGTKEVSFQQPEISMDVEAHIKALKGNGQPLPAPVRDYFEPRFQHDFSDVRVHADSQSAESARAVNAKAFTFGKEIVFGKGEYAPETRNGRHLLAHELTHVAQQTGSSQSDLNVRRACGPKGIGPKPDDCVIDPQPLGERRYLFKPRCDDFAPGEQERLQHDLAVLPPGTKVSILGAASSDGNRDFNVALSCARARAAASAIGSAPSSTMVTSIKAVGPQGPQNDPTFRAVSVGFDYPGPRSRVPPSGMPNIRKDKGWYIPKLPPDPVGAFTVCQTIPPIAPAVCGTAVTGLSCPSWYCTPFPTVGIARECRDKSTPVLLAGIAAVVADPRVIPYWLLFLNGGTSNQLDMTATFGTEFAGHAVSQRAANYLSKSLEAYLRKVAPSLFVGPGPWTIDFSGTLLAEIANLETAGHPEVMTFAPASTIPGLLAGGVGSSACAAGLIPSAFDDHRLATVSATVMRTRGGLLVTPWISFRVEDTIDFCPGNCGTGAALAATVLLSRLEASGVSGDVPFLVDYTRYTKPFIV